MSIMLFAGVFAGILARLASAAIRKSMTGAILKSLGSGAIVLSLMAGTVAAADQLSITLKVGQTPTGSDSYLYRQISAGGIISEDGISGSVPGMTVRAFSSTNFASVSMSGAPTTPGVYSVTAYFHYWVYENQCTGDPDIDEFGCENVGRQVSVTVPGTITVEAATLTVNPDSLGSLAVAQATTVSLSTSGGYGSYSYVVTDGELPAGLSLSGSTISGTPTTVQTYDFSITATDSYGNTGVRSYSGAVLRPVPTVTLAVSDASPSYGDLVTLTATLADGNAPSGTVTFKDGSTTLGSVSLSGSTATYITSGLASGDHSITAVYGGDGNNERATSSSVSVTVAKAAPTVTLSASDAAATIGEPITFTANLSGGIAPTGTVTFMEGSNELSTASLSGSSATLTTADLAVGSHTLKAVYSGDGNNQSITSSEVDIIVAKATPTLAVTASDSNPLIGSSVTLTASLTDAVSPTGSVTFKDGATVLGTETLAGGSASLSLASLSAGSHSITAVFDGDTANEAATSAAITVDVGLPTLSLAPAAGSLDAGTANEAYNETFSATDGTSPYSFAVTSGDLPDGLTLSSSGTLSGTPTAEGDYSFTVTATDANGATGDASYSLAIAVAVPVASDSSVTVTANSSANAATLDLSGGTASSLTLVSSPAYGSASVSGTTIFYTPDDGYSGTDSFSYTASNASGTSAVATVWITVSAPALVLSPSGGTLSSGTVASAYSASVSASEGTAPYSFAVTSGSLPDGLTLSSNGTLSGTPTVAGGSSFTITATDSYGATGSASYSLTVTSPDISFRFSPSSGSLQQAMAGEDYSQSIIASGGSGSLIYSVTSGSLPPGMVLNISTGTLSGPLDDGSEGSYRFTIGVRDGNGSTGSADYSLTVIPRAVTVPDQAVTVAAGETPADVYLNRGATGGPFISAELVSVEPSNAGTATIRSGDLADASGSTPVGWYLQFTPNPAYSGQARVGYRLFSALGNSNAGTITYTLSHNPDDVADEVSAQVEDFVRTRQSLIASSLHVPGLIERRRMDQSKEAVSTRMTPGEDGMSVGFSTSLAQINAARHDGKADPSRFNLWIDGSVSAFTDRDETGDEWGSFAMLNLGADYLVTDRLLLGLSFHYDRINDPTDAEAAFKGDGWLAGPYASLEIAPNVFWDTSLLYGGSVNSVDTGLWSGDFDTRRIFADTAISGQWLLSPETTLTPKLRAVYFSETVEDYTVDNGSGDSVSVDGFDEEQFRLSLGAELARSFTTADGGSFTPKLGLNAGYAGLDGAGAFASASAGISWQPDEAWTLDARLLFTIEGDGATSVGVKAGAGRKF